MGDRRHCWLVGVLFVLAWMYVAVAIVPVVASLVLVSSVAVSYVGEDGFALAYDEHVFFFEYVDAFFCED